MRCRNGISDAIESVCSAERSADNSQNDEEDVKPNLTSGDAF